MTTTKEALLTVPLHDYVVFSKLVVVFESVFTRNFFKAGLSIVAKLSKHDCLMPLQQKQHF